MLTTIARDKIWKATIEDLADDFLRYFYPEWAENEVDFNRPFEFLDNELDKLFPTKAGQNRRADKLIKVFLKSGEEKWVLVHVEVQDYPDTDFAERMFTYFYRLKDKYQVNISALVIYTDDHTQHHPTQYEYKYLDTELCYKFATFEVISKTEAELDKPNNPFSVLLLWVKATLEKPQLNDNQRFAKAVDLVRRLERENPSNTKKLQTLLNFLRFYFKFGRLQIGKLDSEITEIFKETKPMGMQELLEMEYREFYRAEGKKEGRKEGRKEERLRFTIQNINKFLENNLLDIKQIAEFLEIELQFVEDVRDGKIYIHPETDEIIMPETEEE